MSTQAHTPGPWTCDPTREFSGVKWDKIVRSAQNDPICSIYVAGYASEREPQANARLIAAAPDMLDALKWIEMSSSQEARQTVRAAIAKAEGRSGGG